MLKSSINGKEMKNLQIVIDNSAADEIMEADDEEMLEIDNDENSFEAPVITKTFEVSDKPEKVQEEEETEFLVHLNSVPPAGLQNTSLVSLFV